MSHEDVQNGAKRLKLETVSSFKGFEVLNILKENSSQNAIFVHGKFNNSEDDAVVLLNKKPFDRDHIATILSESTVLKETLKNDIYGTYDAYPTADVNAVKATVIYPATKKHILKYSEQDLFLVNETRENYEKITLPVIESQNFSIQWVYNILTHVSESERIVYEDTDPEVGFILLPDMKWDRKDVNSLYLVAIVHQHGIKSLRDLTDKHLPLLTNVHEEGKKAILQQFGLPASKLRIYLHYQPSYYHLHVHFTHIKLEAPGTGVERAHLLSDVIENIELNAGYYQKKTLTYLVKENDALFSKYKEADTSQ